MNSKKKNKKAHKPPNPTPPQNVEIVTKKEETEELPQKCEVKDELLPVCSEVSEVTVSDVKELEMETPKKPKRNKSKNHKKDKEEEKIELPEQSEEVQTELIAKNIEPLQKLKSDNNKCEEKQDVIDVSVASVVPSARKKKNKKKAQEKATEQEKVIVEPILTIDTLVAGKTTEEPINKIETDIQELFSSKPETPKLESKKKKNKKKNRTDSEKSDNIVPSTTDLQSLLPESESKLISSYPQPETIGEAEKNTIELKLCSQPEIARTENVTSTVESAHIDEVRDNTDNLGSKPEVSKDEPKGKKKNKKDKKQQQKDLSEALKPEVSEEICLPLAENVLSQTIPSSELVQDVQETIPTSFDTYEEKKLSPKPKAKIAKPVEKKRKGKHESESIENLSEIGYSELIREKHNTEQAEKSESQSKEAPTVNITESQFEAPTSPLLPAILGMTENISIPSDHTMGKKRKKSPIPFKNNTISDEQLETEEIRPESCEMLLDLQPNSQVVPCDPVMPSKLPEIIPEQILQPHDEPLVEMTQTISHERPITPEMKKDNEGFEMKISKKKKKTHKVPQVEPTMEIKEPITEVTKSDSDKQVSENTKQGDKNTQASIFLEPKEDKEVQSLTEGSEPTSCDVIPDVHFIRSSSQHSLDSNNNTVIQEVINLDDVKLIDPQLTPLIEGSGTTPARTPERVSSEIKMTLIEAKTPTEEKTDIKSKMMEVNQDMEELRLSIERSLAEFTAIEKSERDSEKKSESLMEKEKSPMKDNKRGKNVQKSEKHIKNPSSELLPKETKEEEMVLVENKKTKPEGTETLMPQMEETISSKEEMKNQGKPNPILTKDRCDPTEATPICPARKDNKGKSKSKKKGKQESTTTATAAVSESSASQSKDPAKEKEESAQKSEQTSKSSQETSKQQSNAANDSENASKSIGTDNGEHPTNAELPEINEQFDFEPIENFEDALTSSIDDVNKTFEMIAKEADNDNIEFQKKLAANKPEINITTVEDTDKNMKENENPVSQPKNLLGQTDIPVQSNRTDYKKEKNKTPNARQARVKIKDSMEVESKKQSKESQTDNKKSRKALDKSVKESFSRVKNDNDEYVYKYSFRKVFLQSSCHVCNRDLNQVRVPCGYCNLIFYCGAKHKDEDWPQHQALCFAVCTLAHMKDQKHIYADAASTVGQEYRLLRMQMIVSCERVLKRRLVPWEQELMLYPRMCTDVACREWRQGKLKDCDGCGQLSFCAAHPDHLPKAHSRWCKSYSLYQKLVSYQQTKGRLEPRLPTRVLAEGPMPGKMNEVLATMYEEKIDMNDIQYASLTQLATAPLTAAYCLQLCRSASGITNGVHQKHPFTIHVVGAELQFEADALNKWETFFLHLRPDVDELRVVLVSPQLNPGNLPLDLLGRIKICDNCQQNKRRVTFKFEDSKNYFEYRSSENFINPDIICAFNPSIQRSSIYNGKDPWPASINTILKLKTPFIITSYTLNELRKDIARIKQVSDLDFKLISEPGFNSFASVRPDRNFISDDEMPLLFKNYCVAVVLGC